MWPRRDLLDLLGIDVPVIQAPMAGFSTPDLAAAVANAGGLGSIGCAQMTPLKLEEAIEATRGRTNRPVSFNFLLFEAPRPEPERAARMRAALAPIFDELDLGPVPEPGLTMPVFGPAQLEVLIERRPPVVSFHLGLPAAGVIDRLKEAGIKLLLSATTVAEARAAEAAGADVVVAQGVEAGGHRGCFDPDDDATIGTMALVPQVVDAVSVPVVAAGGIADGRGLAAAFALGASGAQIGTAFLGCPEAATSRAHRRRLEAAAEAGTRITRLISGRPARAIRNRLLDGLRSHEADAVAYPAQLALTAPLRQRSADQDDDAFASLWAGQAAALARPMPAAALVEALVRDARRILG